MANEFIARKGLIALADSQITGSLNLTGNVTTIGTISGEFASSTGTAISGAFTSTSESIASDISTNSSSIASLEAASGSYLLNTTDTFTGDLTVTGEVIAQTLNVQQVTSSVVYSSGSNVFGNSVSNTQQFTGSLQVSGSTHYLLGNVGIGTDSPEEILDINGSVLINNNEFYKVESTAGTNYKIAGLTNGNVIQIGAIDYTSAGTVFAGGDSVSITTGGASGDTRMYISGSGNVGIGVSTVLGGSKLHISSANGTAYTSNAQLRISGANTNNNRAQILFSDDALSDGKLSYYPAAGTGAYFSLSARNTESDFILNASGNVGIGTTSPTGTYGKLTVNGSISLLDDQNTKLEIGRYSSGASNSYIKLGANSNSLRITNNTDTADLLYIQNGGGVRIGIDTNAIFGEQLTVNGDILLSDGSFGSGDKFTMMLGDANAFMQSEHGQKVLFGAYNGFRFSRATSNNKTVSTDWVTIDDTGNVGIGTTTPFTKTHIYDTFDPDDTYGYLLVENGNTSSGSPATNAAVNVKNYHGTSQFMQWEENGLRIGSRITANGGAGDVVFTAGNDSERMRLLAAGGLTFNGDTAAANALDDYEEGTISTSVNGITATTNSVTGIYTKIGNMVYAQVVATIAGKSSGTGNPYIPLPFTPSADNIGQSKNGANFAKNTMVSGLGYLGLYGANAQVYANTTSGGYIGESSWSDGDLSFTIVYRVN